MNSLKLIFQNQRWQGGQWGRERPCALGMACLIKLIDRMPCLFLRPRDVPGMADLCKAQRAHCGGHGPSTREGWTQPAVGFGCAQWRRSGAANIQWIPMGPLAMWLSWTATDPLGNWRIQFTWYHFNLIRSMGTNY